MNQEELTNTQHWILLICVVIVFSFILFIYDYDLNKALNEIRCGDEDIKHTIVYNEGNKGYGEVLGYRCCKIIENNIFNNVTGEWKFNKYKDCFYVPIG